MEILALVLSVVGLVLQGFLAFAVFHAMRLLLSQASLWRETVGQKPLSDKTCFVLALASALALII